MQKSKVKSEKLTLVIGDQNFSSWSMRPWLVIKQSGLPFEEKKIFLDRPNTREMILKHSPTGKVPVLHHGQTVIWDSMAICEYLHELAPEASLYPLDPALRAQARSYVAEMHSGFSNIRTQLSMDIRLRMQIQHLQTQTISEIRRILSLWTSALKQNGGPFLFGQFGIVDAFYAPVVMRFNSYGIQVTDKVAKAYMKRITSQPHVAEWIRAGLKEKQFLPKF